MDRVMWQVKVFLSYSADDFISFRFKNRETVDGFWELVIRSPDCYGVSVYRREKGKWVFHGARDGAGG